MNGVQLLLVIVGAIGISAIAQRRGLQPALLITVFALAVSFIPGIPRFELSSEVILGLVLPPLLYSAAINSSFFSFVRNIRPILGLGVGLVLVTALVVGFVGSAAVPALSMASALILGAIVAPPDAVTATAIGQRLGLPKRVMTILSGESLVNDAAALTLFTITVAAVAGTHTFIGDPVLLFLYSAIVGLAVGLVLAWATILIRRLLKDPGLETVLGLVVPFAAYLLAEQLEASGVLAVVAAGFSIGVNASRFGYETRLQERQVWASLDVLLEAFVFAYMGLQLRFVIEDVATGGGSVWGTFGAAGLVLLAVLLVRPVWVFAMYGLSLLVRRRFRRRFVDDPRGADMLRRRNQMLRARGRPPIQERPVLDWRESIVVSWTGMRGVVTLAAAAGVPVVLADGTPFPGRGEIQAIAFVVAVGTLLLQGTTLPWLIRLLDVKDPGEAERDAAEQRKAGEIAHRASGEAFRAFAADPPEGFDPGRVKRVTEMVASRRREADETSDMARTAQSMAGFAELYRQVIAAQRAAIVEARNGLELDDDAARDFLENLDLQEAALESRLGSRLTPSD